jgi:two-component system, chemotaxis family, sensor kinase CheA
MDDDILQEFLAESWENLSQLDVEIIQLEKQPDNSELLASIFRTIHTIKGTCGFIGLTNLGAVAHAAENILGQMRNGELAVTGTAISTVLEAIDCIKGLLQTLETTGQEGQADHHELIDRLDALALASTKDAGSSSATTSAPAIEGGAAAKIEAVDGAQLDGPQAEGDRKSVADLSIRVGVDVLDSLMNLVGELVLTRNQLLQMVRGHEESVYSAPIAHLNHVTTDLQEGVMKTRMQPIGTAWSKLPRLVRDLSHVTGKSIELEMTGAETELDRTVLDAIKDPLTHMVRNSADHGIEPPDIRRKKGKPEVGTIRLHAFHDGGHVIICIEDDGAGIDFDKVRTRAVQQGLVSDTDAARLSENEILQFLFRPGFSTADKVSSVSGRGVGMDVVRTQIEKIGGTVDLTSALGVGSTVRIKIPLTLAIISALVVEAGGESFAIPQLGVVELVRLTADDAHSIERINENKLFRLRDRLLPLVHLSDVLELPAPADDADREVKIVVVQVGEEQLGLVVSEVFDTEEIVVKPVGSMLKDVNIYQGTTILGDGRVILILDVAGIASQFGGIGSRSVDSPASLVDDDDGEKTNLLLFNAGEGTTMAVPLSLVARLEELPRQQIERTGDRLVVQYRGDLLPLVSVNGYSMTASSPDPQPFIVFSEGKSAMGLLIHQIEDITEERIVLRMQSHRPGVLGTAIVAGRATEIIDTQHYIMQANPDWFVRSDTQSVRRTLIVDDSLFFRQLVATALAAEGDRVIMAESAVHAVEMLERGDSFDVIVSDIEMPMMSGIEFAEWLRSRPQTKHTPLVAMTSLSVRGQESCILRAGFDQFLVKFNAQQLVTTIEDLCMKAQLNFGVGA